MQIRLRELAIAELPCRTRLPFRFGAVTVTSAPLLHLRARVEAVDGRSAIGMASDLLVPKWFRKDLDRPAEADQAALRGSVREAARRYASQGFLAAFEHWLQVHQELVESLPPRAPGALETGFGVALVERAMLDGLCRLAGASFWSALRTDLFRRRLLLSPEGHWPDATAVLPERPLQRIAVRHTVGRLDPLRASELPPTERLGDGFPQALDEVLAHHGVRWLKIKIGGGHDADVQRLCAIGRLLDDLGADGVKVTLDGNEQFADFAALREVWRATGDDRHGRALLQRVRWVEQPLPRGHDERDGDACDASQWACCPLVLDEGDERLATFVTGHHLGVSVKNCKGVLRAFANREEVARLPGHRFQSSEDLTNLPALALQQDLCTASCLDLAHSERNGHHYFPGFAHLPSAVAATTLAAHPDLYAPGPGGGQLRIEAGHVSIASLHGPGFGCDHSVVAALDRELAWSPLE